MRKADRVAHDLMSRVVSGELPVGATLPKESELASRYDVNRSVVREAIKLLEVHRLVRPVRRKGTEVLDPVTSMSPEVLRAMLVPHDGRIDIDTLSSFLEIRTHLDIFMTGLACQRRTEPDLVALDACFSELADHVGDPLGFAEVSERFVQTVARATQNVLLEMLVHWNQRVQRDLSNVFLGVRPANEATVQGCGLLVELIRQKDAAHAESLVSAYHEWATPRWLAAAALANGAPLSELVRPLPEDR